MMDQLVRLAKERLETTCTRIHALELYTAKFIAKEEAVKSSNHFHSKSVLSFLLMFLGG
jgi:hypothetical protein